MAVLSASSVNGASDGRILEVANGYRGKFEVIPGLSVDPAAEYIEVIKGEGTSGMGGARSALVLLMFVTLTTKRPDVLLNTVMVKMKTTMAYLAHGLHAAFKTEA